MKEVTKALLNAQKAFPVIKKDANNLFFKSKYADLASILETVIPILNKQGLVLVQHPITEGDRIGVRTVIYHGESGENIVSDFTVNLAKNDPQGAGSAITYCRRYAVVSILGLNVDDDDDGNTASNRSNPRIAVTPKINNVQEDIEL